MFSLLVLEYKFAYREKESDELWWWLRIVFLVILLSQCHDDNMRMK